MKALPSTQTIAIAAASAAALATATTAAYRLYLSRRHDQHLQPHQTALRGVATLSVPRTTHVNSLWNETLIHATLATTPTTQKRNLTNNSFQWAVFWDIENVPIPRTTTPSRFVKALREKLAAYRHQTNPDPILRIHAIANIRRTSVRLRHHLQANGVTLTHVESKGRKDVADKALITEICLTTREYATPFGICLISGDGDFSYAISRLTALGYDTVVIAPTSKSFSSLLAAVPGAVIPLSAVLEACREPSEPEFSLGDNSHTRTTNPQKETLAQHAKQTVSVHASRCADRRAARAKRRERVILSSAGKDESDSSTSRKSAAPFVQDNKLDSQILSRYFHKSYMGKYGTVSASPAQITPFRHDQTQVKPALIRKRVNRSRDKEHEIAVETQSVPTNRAVVENATRANSGKKSDADNPTNGLCSAQGRNGKVAMSPAKMKKKGNIVCEPDQAQVKQDIRAERKGTPHALNKGNGQSKKQCPVIQTNVTSDIPVGAKAMWLYIGVRLLPSVILLLMLVYSFVMKLLVKH